MSRVCIVVDNEVLHDVRIQKYKKTLAKRYDVIVVGISKDSPNNKRLTDGTLLIGTPFLFILSKFLNFFKKRYFNIEESKNMKDVGIVLTNKLGYSPIKIMRDFIKIVQIIICQRAIYKSLLKIKADIYHANDLPCLKPTIKAAERNKARVIYDSHELYIEQGIFVSPFGYNKYYHEEKEYVKKASRVITVNEYIAKFFKTRYDLRDLPTVVYNYPFKRKLIENIKSENQFICLIYHGRYSPYKGLESLISAMRYVTNEYVLYLRGFGPLENKLRAMVNKYGLKNKVIFLDPVSPEDLAESASFADIGALFYEANCLNNYLASPNKLFEYINAGLAIISNDIPFIKNIIRKYDLGMIVDRLTPEKIAEAINIFNKKNVEKFKYNSKKISEIFTWEQQEAKILELYDMLKERCLNDHRDIA